MKNKNGFTLAEVLITLGIIGVVAAMTLPTLLNSTQAAQFRSQYKKTMAVASQALALTLALDDYDAGHISTTSTGEDGYGNPHKSLYNMFHDRINVVGMGGDAGYAESWDGTDGNNAATTYGAANNWTFYLNDGSVLSVKKAVRCYPLSPAAFNTNQEFKIAHPCKGFIDVNGPRKPNRLARCDVSIVKSKGKIELKPLKGNCKVNKAYDIIPIRIYEQTIEPNSEAGRYLLYKAGK